MQKYAAEAVGIPCSSVQEFLKEGVKCCKRQCIQYDQKKKKNWKKKKTEGHEFDKCDLQYNS
jgi:hypothetical protein